VVEIDVVSDEHRQDRLPAGAVNTDGPSNLEQRFCMAGPSGVEACDQRNPVQMVVVYLDIRNVCQFDRTIGVHEASSKARVLRRVGKNRAYSRAEIHKVYAFRPFGAGVVNTSQVLDLQVPKVADERSDGHGIAPGHVRHCLDRNRNSILFAGSSDKK